MLSLPLHLHVEINIIEYRNIAAFWGPTAWEGSRCLTRWFKPARQTVLRSAGFIASNWLMKWNTNCIFLTLRNVSGLSPYDIFPLPLCWNEISRLTSVSKQWIELDGKLWKAPHHTRWSAIPQQCTRHPPPPTRIKKVNLCKFSAVSVLILWAASVNTLLSFKTVAFKQLYW